MLKNSVLKKQIQSILSSSTPTQFQIQLSVSNKDGSLKLTPYDLDGFSIIHEFVESYTSKSFATWKISPADYAKIYDSRSDLKVTVKHIYLDATGHPVNNPKPVVKKYQGVMTDPNDIRKSMPNVNLLTTPDRQITLTLIDEKAYKIRFAALHGTWVNSTIEQVMIAILNSWDIKKIHLTPSQNPHKYDHVVVPPYKHVYDIFGFLQMKYGIYMQGIASYYYDDYFWIFPSHDTTTEYDHPTTLKFFKAEEGNGAGMTCFHKKDSSTSTSIVINQQPKFEDRSQLSSENNGTGVMFLRASQGLDGMTNQVNGQITYNQQTSVIVNMKNNNLADPKQTHMRYAHQTDNLHQVSSSLSSQQNIEAHIVWSHADPFTVEPGQKVVFYSDHDGKIGKRQGILTAARFVQTRPQEKGGRVGGKAMFQTVGYLTLLLSPDEQVGNTVN